MNLNKYVIGDNIYLLLKFWDYEKIIILLYRNNQKYLHYPKEKINHHIYNNYN